MLAVSHPKGAKYQTSFVTSSINRSLHYRQWKLCFHIMCYHSKTTTHTHTLPITHGCHNTTQTHAVWERKGKGGESHYDFPENVHNRKFVFIGNDETYRREQTQERFWYSVIVFAFYLTPSYRWMWMSIYDLRLSGVERPPARPGHYSEAAYIMMWDEDEKCFFLGRLYEFSRPDH